MYNDEALARMSSTILTDFVSCAIQLIGLAPLQGWICKSFGKSKDTCNLGICCVFTAYSVFRIGYDNVLCKTLICLVPSYNPKSPRQKNCPAFPPHLLQTTQSVDPHTRQLPAWSAYTFFPLESFRPFINSVKHTPYFTHLYLLHIGWYRPFPSLELCTK